MDAAKLEQLKAFVGMVDSKPEMLHMPQLAFFKSYLEKMGARIVRRDEWSTLSFNACKY
jgi:hypothetical protein